MTDCKCVREGKGRRATLVEIVICNGVMAVHTVCNYAASILMHGIAILNVTLTMVLRSAVYIYHDIEIMH